MTFQKTVAVVGIMTLAAPALLADFSYQETTRITGGALVAAMKVAGVFSKQARQAGEPVQSMVAVKGNRMLHRNQRNATVIDLDSQTITTIEFERKQYTVMTFEQMKQMLAQMQEKMQQKQPNGDQADVKFKVSVDATGKTRQIKGNDAREMIVKMEMEGTDQKTGQTGSMVVIADTWLAPAVPGYREMREFYRRMAEKIDWSPNGNMFMSRPDVAKGMAEAYRESAKLNGIPVFQTTTMGGQGTVPVDASDQPQPQQQSQRPSVGSALGGALGGKFGLGRKKAQQDSDQQQSSDSASAAGVLVEMTTEMSDFSAGAVEPSQFEIPAGFKKVDSEMRRAK